MAGGEKRKIKKHFLAKGSRFMDLSKNILDLFVHTSYSSQHEGSETANLQIGSKCFANRKRLFLRYNAL